MNAREPTTEIQARATLTAIRGSSLRQDIHNPALHRFNARVRFRITLQVTTGRHAPARNTLIPEFRHKIPQAGRQQLPVTVVAHPLARGDILLRETLQDQELSNTVRQEITRLQEGIHPVILPHPVAHTQEAVTVAAVVAVPAVVAEVAVIQAVVVEEVIQAEAEAEAGEGKTIILFICYKYCDHEKADSHFHLNRSYSCWVYPISNRCTQVFQDIL
jgi:hypothetical protein